MRILLINANTSAVVTSRIASEAARIAGDDLDIKAVTADFGASLILSRTDNLIAAHAALTALARHHRDCDAVVLAVSTDAGLGALREISPVPVVGMTEASLLTACMVGGRFGLIVFDSRAVPVFRELVGHYGLQDRLACIEAINMTMEDFDDPERIKHRILAAADRLITDHAADSVVITGATMAGVAHSLQAVVKVPLIDGISSAVLQAATLIRLALPKPAAGSFVPQPMRDPKGIDEALSALLGGADRRVNPSR